MKTIPLTTADIARLGRILKKSKSGTVVSPEMRVMLAVAYQAAIAQGTVIPAELAAVAKALQFDTVIV